MTIRLGSWLRWLTAILARYVRAGIFLGTSLPLGFFWFSVVFGMASLGFSLAALLVGIPVLALTAVAWTAAARLERLRVRTLLGTEIRSPYDRPPPGSSPLLRLRTLLLDPSLWRDLAYVLLLAPAGLVEFFVFVAAVLIPVLLFLYPLLFLFSAADSLAIDILVLDTGQIETFAGSLLAPLAGLANAVLGFFLVRLAARAHSVLARSLLGPLRLTRRTAPVAAWVSPIILMAVGFVWVYTIVDWRNLQQLASSPEEVRAFFEGLGVWGLAILFLLQAAQVVVSLIPASPIMVAGVAAFGPWWGFSLSLSGAVAGSVMAFVMGRRFGRPMVVRLVGEKVLDKYAGKLGADGWWMLVALALPIPVGGDAACSLAGLSEIKAGRFVVLNVVGRTPFTALAVLGASGLATGSARLLAVAGLAFALLGLAAFLYLRRERLREKQRSGLPQD